MKKGEVFLKKYQKFKPNFIFGGIIGLVNGFFGAGGGLILVPLLMKSGMERKSAHANAVAVILPITLVSTAAYIMEGRVGFSDALIYLPGGLIGALIGTLIMKKITPTLIKRIFGIFMVWAGWRMLVG